MIERSVIEAARRYHARRDEERLRGRESLRRQWLAKVSSAVRGLGPSFPRIEAVYAYGSLLAPGRFTERSDVDLAVRCDDPEEEGRFGRALEAALEREVDIRPLGGPIAQTVELRGEALYEREVPAAGAEHPE